jgi:hypothetical protein
MPIGFLSETAVKEMPVTDPGKTMVAFDSGNVVTFAEACMHTIVSGTTGIGKTSSVILPAVRNLLKAGFSGLVLDIKGNMIDHCMAIARECGRENDILEFGTGPRARRINLLHGLDEQATYDMLKTLFTREFAGRSQNMDFHLAGVHATADLVKLCRYLAEYDSGFTPSFARLYEMMGDYDLCRELFELFERLAFGDEEEMFASRITTDSFHPCSSKKDKPLRSYAEQVEYRMHRSRSALTGFMESPGVSRAFCSPDADGLDMGDLIYAQGKIVVLRFGAAAGETAAGLCRYFLEEYYKAVFRHGMELPPEKYTFVAADEFQDIVNFDRNNRFNDCAVIAKSREFRNIFIAGTQSMSALGNNGANHNEIEAFVNNCNNRIMLYSDDPWTQEVARRHTDMDLCALQSGEAMVVKFDLETRRHVFGLETLQQSHDELRKVLDAFGRPGEAVCELPEEAPPKLRILLKRIQNQEKAAKAAEAEAKAAEAAEMAEKQRRERQRMEQQKKSEAAESDAVDTPDVDAGNDRPAIVKEFPEFFKRARSVEDFSDLHVPSAWLALTRQSLAIVRESGIPLEIRGFAMNDNHFIAYGYRSYDERQSIGMTLLNSLLEQAGTVCILCGQAKPEKKYLCPECAARFEPGAVSTVPCSVPGK